MLIPFRALLKGALRDRMSLFYATLFPIGLLIGLGAAFGTADYRAHLLAGMLAASTLFFSLFGIAFESMFQRNSGVYKLLRATPYRTVAFAVHLTAARGVIALASCALVAVVGAVDFGLAVSWHAALLLAPVLAMGTLCFTFLGLVVGNLAQRENSVAMLCNLFCWPMIFASETFYSLAGAPGWVRALNEVLPLGHLIAGVRAALAGDLGGTLGALGLLAGYTALALGLAVVTFRWDADAPPLRLGRVRSRVAA
jgi:ABC-2 type transport system permease protein